MKRFISRFLPGVLALLAACLSAEAAVDLVTLPGKEYTQLTIYNTADLTLARERRVLTFKKGRNRIQFSWANTLIDPTSLQFRVLAHEDKIVLLDTTYPPNRREALQWNVVSQVAGPVLVEISYFTSGLTWKAEYAGISNFAETEMTFRGYVRIFNNSGEEYENARTRLMVGTVHLIERIADLAQGKFRTFTPEQREQAIKYFLDAEAKYRRMTQGGRDKEFKEAKGIAKEGLSEYFIFTIEGEETVRNTWSKRLQAVFAERVPIETYYRLSDVTTGGKVIKFYKFANRKFDAGPGKGALGTCPLPNGGVRIFNSIPTATSPTSGPRRSITCPWAIACSSTWGRTRTWSCSGNSRTIAAPTSNSTSTDTWPTTRSTGTMRPASTTRRASRCASRSSGRFPAATP